MSTYPRFDEDTFNKMVELTNTCKYLRRRILELDSSFYMVFSYVYNGSFKTPYERECRGSMFKVTESGEYIEAVCRPFEKFFDHTQIEKREKLKNTLDEFYGKARRYRIFEKIDGSIISSYIHQNMLHFKSNKAVDNNHINVAVNYLSNHQPFWNIINIVTKTGYTIMFELTSPDLKIVVPYEDVNMTIIGVRDIEIGTYWDHETLVETFGEDRVVKEYHLDLDSIKKMEDIEGFVVTYGSEMRIKYKTDWYLEQGKKRTSFEARIIHLLRSKDVTTDPVELKTIQKFEHFVQHTFDKLVEKSLLDLDNKLFMSNFSHDKLKMKMATLYRFKNIKNRDDMMIHLIKRDSKALSCQIEEWKKELLDRDLNTLI